MTMVKRCQWGLCNTDSRYPERIEGVRFIPFPKPKKNLEKCKRWIKACGRPHEQLNVEMIDGNYHMFVCSKHFPEEGPTEKFPDPLPAGSSASLNHCTPIRPPPKRRCISEPPKKKRRILTEIVSPSENCAENTASCSDTRENATQTETKSQQDESLCVSPLELLSIAAENRLLKETLAKQVLENERLRQERVEISKNEKSNPKENHRKNKFNVETVQKSKIRDNFKYYTGFTYEQFTNIYKFLVIHKDKLPLNYSRASNAIKKMELDDQVLLTFIKLRLNFEFKHLAYLFELSTQDAGAVFRAWVNYMFYKFGSVPIWPDREVIYNHMPSKFKEEFPTTFVILDGTEIKVERPSALRSQSQCYSDYKSATTLKSLVGVDPRGSFMFISTLFSGSISDKEITSKSGLLTLLQQLLDSGKLKKGDGVMVDKGFPIKHELEGLGLKLVIPPFAPGSGQMSAPDVALTKKIAAHRVHVERAISRAKKFKIVDNRIDLALFPCVNQIWFCCCFLTGFMPLLIQDH